jgi:cellulose synthase/poly-beta-1,6-N-acetylglucosamine synthase-like glycosyltransferase
VTSDVPVDSLDLFIVSLLGLFVSAGFAGAFFSLLATGRAPRPADVPLMLLIPVTGSSVDLERLARLISAQWLTPRRIVFIVEAVEDPAFERLKQVLAHLPGGAEIFVAGPASAAAQKSHNLARALSHHDDGSQFIVLADADIAPQPHWLADIVQPLARGRAQMVSGYRWVLPMDCRPGSLVGAWAERAIASLPKPPWYTLAWGGSLGFTPGTAQRIGAVQVLEKAVSDDISLARAGRRHGIDVLYRKRLLVPTPFSHSVPSLVAFGARQYQMLRLHQRGIWWNALVAVSGAMVLKSWLWWHAFTSAFWFQVLVAFLLATYATYGLRMLRARRVASWTVGSCRAEAAMLLVPLFGPVVDVIHLAALLSGWSVSRVDWAHCSYKLDQGRVVGIERRPWSKG